MTPNELHIVNFSGGKDSTYMLLEMIRRNMPIDIVLHADTGMEFPAMYGHIEKVEQYLFSQRGLRITHLKSPCTFEELMFNAVKAHSESRETGYGWPNAVVRWCTGQLKTHLIEEYTKNLSRPAYNYIALAADEQYRLTRESNIGKFKCYPLAEWNVTEAQALAGCYQAGYTWDGLYELFHRVSCWCCPLQSLKELRMLRKHFPDIWSKLRMLDDRAIAQFGLNSPYGQFRKYESVRMLEVRFDFEAEWEAIYGKTNTKIFFSALYHRYQEYFIQNGLEIPEHIAKRINIPNEKTVTALLSYVSDDDLRGFHTEKAPAMRKKASAKQKRHIDPLR